MRAAWFQAFHERIFTQGWQFDLWSSHPFSCNQIRSGQASGSDVRGIPGPVSLGCFGR